MESIILNVYFTDKTSRTGNTQRQPEKSGMLKEIKNYFTIFNVIIVLLIVVGSIIMIQVGFLIWNDVTVWEKDFSSIFFGPRTGENISLGIGMKVIHYYLIGIPLLSLAIVLLFLNRWNIRTKKLNQKILI